jgi:integrase
VFTDINSEPLRKDHFVRSVLKPLLKEAGIGYIRFHDLRHTNATLSLANGDNVKVVSERLGHSSAKMTPDVYAKAIPTLQRESAKALDGILGIYGDNKGDNAQIANAGNPA